MRDNDIAINETITREQAYDTLMLIIKECFYKQNVKLNMHDISLGIDYHQYKILITIIKVDDKNVLAMRIQDTHTNHNLINSIIHAQPSYIDTIKRYLKILNNFNEYEILTLAFYNKYHELLNEDSKDDEGGMYENKD